MSLKLSFDAFITSFSLHGNERKLRKAPESSELTPQSELFALSPTKPRSSGRPGPPELHRTSHLVRTNSSREMSTLGTSAGGELYYAFHWSPSLQFASSTTDLRVACASEAILSVAFTLNNVGAKSSSYKHIRSNTLFSKISSTLH